MVLATSGHKDIGVSRLSGISGYLDNRISGFRGWQACGIGRACGVVKAGGTGGVGGAGGGGMLPGGRSRCQAGGHGARREVMVPGRCRVARQVGVGGHHREG